MSIGCLAAFVEKHNHKVEIWDEELIQIDEHNIDELVADLPKPYVFGITILTAQVARAFALAELLKRKYPDSTVIVGGFHPTALPDECFTETDAIDFVVRGEGERTLVELYEAIRGNQDFKAVDGLTFRDKHTGELVTTGERALIKDLGVLPQFPYERFVAMLDRCRTKSGRVHQYDWGFIVTSRGCPYRCTYCAQRMMTGNTYRWRPIDVVIAELDILINQLGAKSIFFLDDNFCFKRSHTIELCEKIRDAGLGEKCEFSLQTRADNFYKELVPVMRQAGFTSVGFGMETATEKLLDVICKEETVEQHVKAIALARENDMEVAMFMIFGLPTESHADRKAVYKTVRKMGLTHCKFNNLMPYPGTPMYCDLKKTSRFNNVGKYENFTSALSEMGLPFSKRKPLPYVPEESSEIELMRDVIRYNLLMALTPSMIKGVLLRRKGPGWFQLQENWWAKPKEWWHITKFAWMLFKNLVVSFTPLCILEPVMHYRNPRLQRRVPKADIPVYVPSRWAPESYLKKLT